MIDIVDFGTSFILSKKMAQQVLFRNAKLWDTEVWSIEVISWMLHGITRFVVPLILDSIDPLFLEVA